MANSTAPAARPKTRTKAKTILLIEDEEAHVEPLDDIMLLLDTNFTIERVKSIRLLKNSLGKSKEEVIGEKMLSEHSRASSAHCQCLVFGYT